jgi:transglutaminase-like putative cysteine protease
MKIFHLFIFLFTFFITSAQQINYSFSAIPDSLKEHANSVVRLNQIDIVISSRKLYTRKLTRVITILNEYGLKNIDAIEHDNIKDLEATIYDAYGTVIKKIKQKEFKEVSVSSGFEISDDKAIYLDYTPTLYPFTIEYKSEIESVNTAFIPTWYIVNNWFESVQKSIITISYISDLGFKYKECNFENKRIKKIEKPNFISFTTENISAIKPEEYAPDFSKLIPNVLFGLEKFSLEGLEGSAKNWEDFSSWRYNQLLVGTDELTPETQNKIKTLVGDEKDPIKKAKIVYQYVQDKVRYVSIQLGIGGWKPMKAKDVDRLGYGDCKALTNYTRALLEVVKVPSYYTVIYGDENKKDFNPDFVSMQGNHIILAIPDGEKYIWLECTSQTIPFGFQGDFTDDRLALIVKPEGGGIVRTRYFSEKESTQVLKANCILSESGLLKANLQVQSKGLQYDHKYQLERESNLDIDKFYKSSYSYINNLKINKRNFINDKNLVEFTENLDIEAVNFGKVINNAIIFSLNVFNQSIVVPARYRTRMNPFEIDEGMMDTDEMTIEIPKGYSVESKPENFKLESKFGTYKVEISSDENHIIYKRQVVLFSGLYPSSEYEDYRKFKEQIAKYDNAKAILKKII